MASLVLYCLATDQGDEQLAPDEHEKRGLVPCSSCQPEGKHSQLELRNVERSAFRVSSIGAFDDTSQSRELRVHTVCNQVVWCLRCLHEGNGCD